MSKDVIVNGQRMIVIRHLVLQLMELLETSEPLDNFIDRNIAAKGKKRGPKPGSKRKRKPKGE